MEREFLLGVPITLQKLEALTLFLQLPRVWGRVNF